ncbi:alpha-1,6-mannosyltransferase [Geosmithia morbida]|uniref:Mannosyltransferase n=1 Tax=Geosmithia morbida TaxID=1094350 RepID=A0A9P4YQP0_9HYPO|nr:alpha-1,6-mannosyltransferase [Geosmithia morbida]KAF4121358.1 alpha-1,6-mannosyltransferase [Geosmithia morbida]
MLSSLLFIVPLIHLLAAPHTKVEESFNMQATHDLLVYGTPTSGIRDRLATTYDHMTFPGVVPRTFVGAVLLSGVSQPIIAVTGFRHAQMVVRAVLGAFNAACLLVMKTSLSRAFGVGVGRWWTVLMVCQFHIMFYLSRTLPNMFAFGLTTLSFSFILPTNDKASSRRTQQAIVLMTMAAAVFRAELAILLASLGGYLVLVGRADPRALAPVVLGALALSLAISVPIDSYFWQRPVWPELSAFYFNAVQGSSSEWGVSPWHWYFSSALPRLLMNPLSPPLIGFALWHPATSRPARLLCVPSLLFVAVYSAQPHKEARFVFYVVPPLTAAAALGANLLSSRAPRSLPSRLAAAAAGLVAPLCLAASAAMLLVSALNYPGGDALSQLRALVASDVALVASTSPHPDVKVKMPPHILTHADVLTCMTGLTLFGQNPLGLPLALYAATADDPDVDARMLVDPSIAPLLLFDRTEHDGTLGWPHYWSRLGYALEEDPDLPIGAWDVVGVIQAFAGIEFLRPGEEAAGILSEPDRSQSQDEYGEHNILGLGARVAEVRQWVRKRTGGWWVGPRMAPRIRLMRRYHQTT